MLAYINWTLVQSCFNIQYILGLQHSVLHVLNVPERKT